MLSKKNKSNKKPKTPKTTHKSYTKKLIIKSPQTFYIHDNGGRPFKITIKDKTVTIYKFIEPESTQSNNDTAKYTEKPILTYKVQNYFIGISPKCKMTLFSGGYGPKFDGNSILLHINDNNYIYIGEKIYSFTSNAKIVKYISPVGNSDVPYPYAIDSENRVYLIVENVILGEYNSDKYDDPYSQYYSEYRFTKYKGIQGFKLCNEFWDAKYNPFPEIEYDRLVSLDSFGCKNNRKMQIQINGKMKILTKFEYVKLIEEFGQYMKYSPLISKTIVERLW